VPYNHAKKSPKKKVYVKKMIGTGLEHASFTFPIKAHYRAQKGVVNQSLRFM